MQLEFAHDLALDLLHQYGLTHWGFVFDRAKKRFGCCNFTDKTISLSRYLTELNDEDKVYDTLLHEIAHALVGPRHAHDRVWREKVTELGGSPVRCCDADVVTPKGKYTAVCANCGIKFQAQRKRRVACGTCCKKFNRGKYLEDFRIAFHKNAEL